MWSEYFFANKPTNTSHRCFETIWHYVSQIDILSNNNRFFQIDCITPASYRLKIHIPVNNKTKAVMNATTAFINGSGGATPSKPYLNIVRNTANGLQ